MHSFINISTAFRAYFIRVFRSPYIGIVFLFGLFALTLVVTMVPIRHDIQHISVIIHTQLTQFLLWSDGITLDSLYWSKIATYIDCQISWTKRYQYMQCKKHIRRIKRTKEHCSVEIFTKRVVMCCKFHSHACACVLHQFPFFCCHSHKHF